MNTRPSTKARAALLAGALLFLPPLPLTGCGARTERRELDAGAAEAGPDAGRDTRSADVRRLDTGRTDASPDAPSIPDANADSGTEYGLGGPCDTSADCPYPDYEEGPVLSACVDENSPPNGYCRSFCAAPLAPETGQPLTQRDCPDGSVCLPTYRAEDVGFCIDACDVDSDCRVDEGYYCRRDFQGVVTATGICAPPHCLSRGCGGGDCSC